MTPAQQAIIRELDRARAEYLVALRMLEDAWGAQYQARLDYEALRAELNAALDARIRVDP